MAAAAPAVPGPLARPGNRRLHEAILPDTTGLAGGAGHPLASYGGARSRGGGAGRSGDLGLGRRRSEVAVARRPGGLSAQARRGGAHLGGRFEREPARSPVHYRRERRNDDVRWLETGPTRRRLADRQQHQSVHLRAAAAAGGRAPAVDRRPARPVAAAVSAGGGRSPPAPAGHDHRPPPPPQPPRPGPPPPPPPPP